MAQNIANSQDLVVIEDIQKNTLVLKDGSLRQVLLVGGINFSLKSEIEQNIITDAYKSFLNGLDFPIQIIIHSRKLNIEKYLGMLEGRKSEESSPLLQDQIAEYEDFIRKFVSENAIMSKTFLAVVPFTPIMLPTKTSILSSIPFLKKNAAGRKKMESEKQTSFGENLEQLEQRVAQVTEGLAAIGLEIIRLNDEQLVELLYNFYNPETVEKENIIPQKQ